MGADLDGRAAGYLEELHLNHKVRVTNGALSTTAVSQGNVARLALLTAYSWRTARFICLTNGHRIRTRFSKKCFTQKSFLI